MGVLMTSVNYVICLQINHNFKLKEELCSVKMDDQKFGVS